MKKKGKYNTHSIENRRLSQMDSGGGKERWRFVFFGLVWLFVRRILINGFLFTFGHLWSAHHSLRVVAGVHISFGVATDRRFVQWWSVLHTIHHNKSINLILCRYFVFCCCCCCVDWFSSFSALFLFFFISLARLRYVSVFGFLAVCLKTKVNFALLQC